MNRRFPLEIALVSASIPLFGLSDLIGASEEWPTASFLVCLVPSVVGGTWLLVDFYRRLWRVSAHRCEACGYRVSRVPATCPECGRPFTGEMRDEHEGAPGTSVERGRLIVHAGVTLSFLPLLLVADLLGALTRWPVAGVVACFAPAAVGLFLLWNDVQRRIDRGRSGACLECGYRLAPHARVCPECGRRTKATT